MRKVELKIATGDKDKAAIALTAFLPAPEQFSGIVVFASPGGGYGRLYYDMSFPGHDGYSQAEHHVARGHALIAYDHLGVGDSSVDALAAMTIEEIAAHNDRAVRECVRRIEDGSLATGFPAVRRPLVVGIGQSMGGGVSIIMQARHRSFDAVGVLGYSAIHTVLPQRLADDIQKGKSAYAFSRATRGSELSLADTSAQVADFVYPFHWEDVPADILEADMSGGYPVRRTAPAFGSLTIPNCVIAMMAPGYVAAEAAAIDVPVFAGFGERDVSENMRMEPAAYTRAQDITLAIIPRMAHMHNFAGSRRLLWDRIASWAEGVASARNVAAR